MTEPTVKAQTLPDDLKSHWEEAMAEKFPMTIQEAGAWIRNNYDVSVYASQNDTLTVSYYSRVNIPTGIDPYAYSLKGYLVVSEENPAYLGRRYFAQRNEQALISDFKIPSMKKILDDLTSDELPSMR